jgi:hypothetical protein
MRRPRRNILGVIKKVGIDIAGKVLKMRKDGHDLIKMIGAGASIPTGPCPAASAAASMRNSARKSRARP